MPMHAPLACCTEEVRAADVLITRNLTFEASTVGRQLQASGRGALDELAASRLTSHLLVAKDDLTAT